jgi:hypothetical protein
LERKDLQALVPELFLAAIPILSTQCLPHRNLDEIPGNPYCHLFPATLAENNRFRNMHPVQVVVVKHKRLTLRKLT